jgi:hypothetical protein
MTSRLDKGLVNKSVRFFYLLAPKLNDQRSLLTVSEDQPQLLTTQCPAQHLWAFSSDNISQCTK